MGQKFHTFRAPTFNEAYHLMRRQLGEEAVVVRTVQVRDGSFLGFLGRKLVELTAAAAPHQAQSLGRKRSAAEKRYLANADVGSEERVSDSITYFQQLVSDAQKRAGIGATGPSIPPVYTREALASVLPFRKPEKELATYEQLQKEVREMREMLQVLAAENPGVGWPAEFAPHYRLLTEHGVSRKVAASLLAAVLKDADMAVLRDVRVFGERLKIEVRRRISVTGGIALTSGTRRVIALVGATGVGKTTNLAKLAAMFAVREHARVALLTSDTYRVAAPEQLRVYANIIGLPMKVVRDPKEIVQGLREFSDSDLALIDTAGSSQFNLKQMHELKGILDAAQPDEIMLVLSANTQLEELRSMVANFGSVKPSSLLFSKLDETQRCGAMLSIAAETGLPLSYISTGQNVPDDLALAHAGMVAEMILEEKDVRGGPGTQSA
jgi:flagellar biosynthesis protein FlhF